MVLQVSVMASMLTFLILVIGCITEYPSSTWGERYELCRLFQVVQKKAGAFVHPVHTHTK